MKANLYCECGNPKRQGVEGCDRCRAIDEGGHHYKPSCIIGHRERSSGTAIVGRACDRFLESRGLVMTTSFKYGKQAQ